MSWHSQKGKSYGKYLDNRYLTETYIDIQIYDTVHDLLQFSRVSLRIVHIHDAKTLKIGPLYHVLI